MPRPGTFAKLDVDGLVAGFARSGELSLRGVRAVIEAAPGVPVTFHRAFDSLTDQVEAIDRLVGTIRRIDAILTSGGEGTAATSAALGFVDSSLAPLAPDDHRGRWR